MKVLKVLFVLAVVAVLGVVGLGLAVPQVDYSVSINVERPADVVWDAFHDHEKATSWISGLESFELVSGNGIEEGTKYRMTFIEKGEKLVIDETIETVVPHERFVFSSTGESMMMRADTEFEPNANGTTVTSHVTMEGEGILMSALLPLMKGKIAERQQGDLEALKALIEGGA